MAILTKRAEASPDPVRAALVANKPLFATAFLFSTAMSLLALTTSFYMLQVYDRVLSSRSVDTLILLTIIAVIALSVFAALDSLRMRLLSRIGMRVAESLSASVLRAMISTASQTGGATLRTGLRDVDAISGFIASPGLAALIDAPFIFIYLIVLYLLNPIFLVIVIVGGALLIGVALTTQRLTDPTVTRSLILSSRAHEFADDGIRNADVLEGLGMSAGFVGRWRDSWLEALALGSAASDRSSVLSSISRCVRLLIQIFLLGAGALVILDFQATGGVMIGASIIGARALAPIEAIVGSWKSVTATRLSWNRLVALLAQAPKRDEGMPLPAPNGALQVSGVSYAAPGTRKAILSSISFELAPGEHLGIIGPSGSGKSTLIRLIVGAWPCSSGVVRLDGADIYAWPRAEIGRYIGYLPQDVELFAGTIRENIARLGEGDPESVVRAAQGAGAHELILSLPKDYNTDIGDYGHKLSGGQSQRIAIARALYRNPRYVVLDEPNSNLDAAGEAALLSTLSTLKAAGVTTVVAAHRPNVLQGVDKLLVLRGNGTQDLFGPRQEILQTLAKRAGTRPANTVVSLAPTGDGGPGRSGTS